MKTRVLVVLLALVIASGSALALDVGENITIYDGVGSGTGWYGSQEDNEVENGCATGDEWDLDGFFLDGTVLTMVGTYDFENGVPDGSGGAWVYGDLFIDVDGDAQYGTANTGSGGGGGSVNDTFGYDYVLTYRGNEDTSGNPLYSAYALDSDDATLLVWYGQNDEANPWRYDSGGTWLQDGSFDYLTGLDDDLDGDGDDEVTTYSNTWTTGHNAVQVDLAWLFDEPGVGNQNITTHFTMECGNDNLMGRIIVPEPATMVLLGLGLAGIATMRMRKRLA